MYIFLRRQQNTRLLQLETPGHQCGEPNSSNIWINMVMPSGTPTIRTLQDIINTYKYLDLKNDQILWAPTTMPLKIIAFPNNIVCLMFDPYQDLAGSLEKDGPPSEVPRGSEWPGNHHPKSERNLYIVLYIYTIYNIQYTIYTYINLN